MDSKNLALRCPRNDDRQLGRPIASPLGLRSLHYLRKAQLGLQRSLYINRTKDLLPQTFFHRPAQNFWAVTLQNLVQPIDIFEPMSRSAMHDLGEIANRRLSQLQQLLPFQIPLTPFPRYRRHHSSAVLW